MRLPGLTLGDEGAARAGRAEFREEARRIDSGIICWSSIHYSNPPLAEDGGPRRGIPLVDWGPGGG